MSTAITAAPALYPLAAASVASHAPRGCGMIAGGFGIEYDLKREVSRAWVYKDGIKRWADTGEPVEPPKIDIETKND